MAKYYSSTFGKISGKHGNAVAVIRKDGTTYLRLHVPASNPRTDKQQAHRAKFALSSRSLVPFNPIFKDTIGVTNGISTARSHTFNNAIVGEYPNFYVDYEKLMFSFGPLQKLHSASHTRKDGVVTINWECNEMYNCKKDDSVSLVVFNKESNQAIHIKDVGHRCDEIVSIDVCDEWASCDLLIWAYVMSGDKISDSQFVPYSHTQCHSSNEPLISSNIDSQTPLGHNRDIKTTHAQNITIDNINTALHLWAGQAINCLINMLYCLLNFFTQVAMPYSICGECKCLDLRGVGGIGCRRVIGVDRALVSSLKRYNSTCSEAILGKFQYIFSPYYIPIMSSKLQI